MKPVKVFFVIGTLCGGGAERVIVNILKNINREEFEPRLILFEKKGQLLPELPPGIHVAALRAEGDVLKYLVFLRLACLMRKEKPDAVMSFMWYPNFVVLLAKVLSRARCGIVVSERNSMSFSFEGRFLKSLRRIVIGYFYRIAGRIVVNSKDLRAELRRMFNIPGDKINVIYNPLDIERINKLSREPLIHRWYEGDIPVIIAVGRLTKQKGFTYLIRALHIINSEKFPCRLVMLGEGTEENNLIKMARDLQIDDKIDFRGFEENPYKYLANSTVFALSSLHEGFPNVLTEALALGIPAVATRCPTGPAEIITDGIDGLLVPPADERALAGAIISLLLDKELRTRLGEAGKKRVKDFAVKKIMVEYENVIKSVCEVHD